MFTEMMVIIMELPTLYMIHRILWQQWKCFDHNVILDKKNFLS